MSSEEDKKWSIQKAIQTYNIDSWGGGYFGVTPQGHLCVYPSGRPGPTIDMSDVIAEIHQKNLTLPCVVRFHDILRSRVEGLVKTFEVQIKKMNYSGKYFGVYPIKVNQMCEVVEEIVDVGAAHHFGLEAGSKGELLSVLAYNTDPEALTICNGYKDDEYLKLALMGRKLGRKVIIVIEKLTELPRVISLAEELNVEPMIGIRARLSTKGAGKWLSSSGDFAKFGLTVPEIMQAVSLLKNQNMTHILKLFHFHVGSQITEIRVIKEAINEGARIYAKLYKMGFPIEYFDVGGGLGIDYEGSKQSSYSSVNYTLEEYVADVVYYTQEVCDNEDVPHPHLVTESGRSITAHHSCIIMPIFGSICIDHSFGDVLGETLDTDFVKDMREIVSGLNEANLQETFHDATDKKEAALSMFKLGILSLEERAKVEALYWKLCREIVRINKRLDRTAPDTDHLESTMADQYLANFSLFQSAPDHWACDHLFPIVPLQRLDEEPTRQTTIVDITCDSDGKIDKFIDLDNEGKTLALHDLKPGEPYYIGLFLQGAYQDIMGDMHNLFGRVNEVHVFCDDEDPEDFYLEEVIPGDSIADVLQRLQYYPSELVRDIKKSVDQCIKSGDLKPKEGIMLLKFYEDVMKSYTYLSFADQ